MIKLRSIILVTCLLAVQPARAETTRIQTVQLRQGWNAVFLEVNPSNSAPAVVLANTPIDIVACHQGHDSTAQFMNNPGADLLKDVAWGVWYADHRPDSFLKTLHAMYGQQAYLIHAKSDFTWQVTGTTLPPEVHWRPHSYNLVGFSVQSPGAPTFAQFFAGSPAHRHDKIYRLTDGTWRRVLDARAETMRSGEAFWIYCEGNSKYQGPLGVETTTRYGVYLGSGSDAFTLRNLTDHPISPTVEHVPSGYSSVPLSIVVQAVGEPSSPIQSVAVPRPAGTWTQPLPPLEAGRAIRVPLQVRLQDATAFTQSSLLKISTDLGTEVWLPVFGVREDLEQQ